MGGGGGVRKLGRVLLGTRRLSRSVFPAALQPSSFTGLGLVELKALVDGVYKVDIIMGYGMSRF